MSVVCDEKFLSGLFSQLLVCVPSDVSVYICVVVIDFAKISNSFLEVLGSFWLGFSFCLFL